MRRRNFIPDGRVPVHDSAPGATYDIGDYRGALELVLERAGYDELRREQQARRDGGAIRQLGIGLSAYVEITNGIGESEFGSVEITADGRGDRPQRLVLARAGPRDDVRA